MWKALTPLFAATLLISALSGCQTHRYKEFEKIRGGMSKSEVLDVIGGPIRTQRWQGRDRWEYTLYGHPAGDLIREVHFENGLSTYIGPPIKPAISAETQDKINDSINRTADIRDTENAVSETTGLQIQKFEPVDSPEHSPDDGDAVR